MAVGIAEDGLAPQVRLIGGLLLELDALRLELGDELIEPLGLEVDADRALLGPCSSAAALQRERAVPSGQTNRA